MRAFGSGMLAVSLGLCLASSLMEPLILAQEPNQETFSRGARAHTNHAEPARQAAGVST